jgi:hypothetical protein
MYYKIQVYIHLYMCLSGHNSIYETYIELRWCFLKDKSYNNVSQIAENCSGIYPINPNFLESNYSYFSSFSVG